MSLSSGNTNMLCCCMKASKSLNPKQIRSIIVPLIFDIYILQYMEKIQWVLKVLNKCQIKIYWLCVQINVRRLQRITIPITCCWYCIISWSHFFKLKWLLCKVMRTVSIYLQKTSRLMRTHFYHLSPCSFFFFSPLLLQFIGTSWLCWGA